MGNVVDLSSLGFKHDVGKLEQIKDGKYEGCYRVIGGALGTTNSEGHFFANDKKIIELFSNSSTLQRVIDKKSLKGEMNHPTRKPGETKQSFAFRFMNISMDRVGFLIRRVEVLEPMKVSGQSKPVYYIMLTIEPIGQYADAVRSELENPNSNTSFSIRCLSKKTKAPDGSITRRIYNVVTWDMVNEPGILDANKENTLKLKDNAVAQTTESFVDIELDDLISGISDDLTTESNSNPITKEEIKLIMDDTPIVKDFLNRWNSGSNKE